MSNELDAVVCYWEFSDQAMSGCWKLMESFGIDYDGRPVTTPSTGGGDRCEWNKWLEDANQEPIMGRAVTIWNVQSGVRLSGFYPPVFVAWLPASFYEEVCKNQNWMKIIDGSYTMWFGTAREAEKYLTFKSKQ